MKASKYFQNDIVISFGDVIVDDKIMKQIVESTNEFGIAVDLKWEKNYVNRDQHPKSEAENVLFDKDGNVLEIKKNIQKQGSKIGEYLGVMKLSRKNSKVFLDKYLELKISHQGKFHNAVSLESAYLTDMFQELINSGIRISPIYVSGKWCEIDTPQDLKNAQKIFEE
jgi:choline kinase